MKKVDYEEKILNYVSSLPIIDAHEHFKSETHHIVRNIDFSFLFHYAIHDLYSASMPRFEGEYPIYDSNLSMHEKWKIIQPYWKAIKYGSYAEGIKHNIKFLTGDADLNDGNYETISNILKEQNKPGIYKKYLEQFNIKKAIVSNGTVAVEPHYYSESDLELFDLIIGCSPPLSRGELEYYETATGRKWRSADDIKEGLEQCILEAADKSEVIGFKAGADPLGEYDIPKADAVIKALWKDQAVALPEQKILNRYFYDEAMNIIRTTGLPVAVHCGVWGDFRYYDVTNFIDLIKRNPAIPFDLFHMSMPSTRETGFVVKNFPNAFANVCWSHLVSPVMFENSLDEWLDIVPVNKISGFGGDIVYCPQFIYGYLEMCKKSYARVFAQRIERGKMDFDDVCCILSLWMYENPKRIYKIKDQHCTGFQHSFEIDR